MEERQDIGRVARHTGGSIDGYRRSMKYEQNGIGRAVRGAAERQSSIEKRHSHRDLLFSAFAIPDDNQSRSSFVLCLG